MAPSSTIPIGELSRLTGCNIETIRYYERIGLLPKAARRGRYRSFGTADVARLNFVRRARELGFTLDEIRALLRLAEDRDRPCTEAREVAVVHLTDIRTKIADLQAMESVLAETVVRCADGKTPECPLLETLFGSIDPSARPPAG